MAATELPVPSADRLSALWSFTRAQQHTNPTGYENNVQWWGGALGAVLRAGKASAEGDTLVLRLGDDLLARLDNGRGARPRGIAGVVVS
jgi:charged multivesicular body protein 7